MKNWKESLSLYIEGELSQDERAKVEAQLASCENLRAQYENLQLVMTALKNLPAEELPFGLHGRMMQVAWRERKKRFVRWAGSFGSVAAAAVLLLVFVLGSDTVPQAYHYELAPFEMAWGGLDENDLSTAEADVAEIAAEPPFVTHRHADEEAAAVGDMAEAQPLGVMASRNMRLVHNLDEAMAEIEALPLEILETEYHPEYIQVTVIFEAAYQELVINSLNIIFITETDEGNYLAVIYLAEIE